MSFGHIRLLYLLLLVPVAIVAYAFDGQRRRRALEHIGNLPMLRRMTASASPGRRRWRAILTVAAMGLTAVALARPQLPGRAKLTESRGLDLVVALDFSRSMLARDVYPTRLDRAKRELDHLIDSLKGDRVGLVAFAGETMAYPLTVDYEAAKLFWRDLGPDDMPVGGSDLGRAIRVSMELLQSGKKENDKRKGAQVILLLTDGEDTEGQGVAASREAAARGVRIYTLGIGSAERPFVQLTDEEGKTAGYLTGADGEPVRVGLDETALRQIAAATGGDYVTLDPRRFGVERVQAAIANLERTQEEARFEREPEDVGRFFLLPALILLLMEASVRERRRLEAKATAPAAPLDIQKAALIFLMLFPFVTGFDLFQRRDPNVEQGNQELAAGKADKALEAYDRAAGNLPEEPIVRFDRGAALYQLGKFPEAQKEFLRATESRDPALKADAYYNMGNSLMKQERFKEALDAYKHTLSLRPEDRRAKWNLELALRRLKEEQQKKQQQQQQSQQQKDQQQKDQQSQQQKDQQQKEQQQKEQQQKDQQAQQQKDQQQQQKDQQQKDQQAKQQQQKDQQPKDQREQQAAQAKKEAPKEIDKQDAEAVLDALERVEPTVQRDLARRRAGSRRPTKDW